MRLWLGLIIFCAFLLRVVGISNYPIGFTPDEASWGYDAYSLLKTGKDQWGESWPLTFRSFGDFKLPLYAYLTVPSVALLGLDEFATRLPNALVGTLAVLATYLLVKELFRQSQLEIGNWKLEILAALLLAISPWHMTLSRGAFEANLTTFFLPFGVWAFLKAKENPWWLVVSSLSFGLNLFSYHSARFLTPVIVLALIFGKYTLTTKSQGSAKQVLIRMSVWKHKLAVGMFGVFLLAAVYTMFFGAGARGADIAIFNPTDKWTSVADRRYEAVLSSEPDIFARIFSNKAVYTLKTFTTNYFSYLSPQFLFTQGVGEWTYGMIPGRGVLYFIEVVFILAAVWSYLKIKSKPLTLILLWILLSPLPTALTKGPGYAGNRAAVMMPAIQILSAYGALVLWDIVKNKWPRLKRYILPIYLSTYLLFFGFFLEDYIYHAPKHAAGSMLYGRREALEFTQSVEDKYSTILVSRTLSEPHIYVGFYNKWDPADFQKESQDWLRYEKEGLLFVDQLGEYKLGKYVFRNIDYFKDKNQKFTLLVGKSGEFPQSIKTEKEIVLPDGKPVISIVSIVNEEE
ncbi:MAG: glycosyltransferase family 39 protein [Patescibacteria group bacterium]